MSATDTITSSACPFPRRYYFRHGSSALAHGIIGIEYEPAAHLPSHSPFSRMGQWLKGQSHAGPVTTLLVDHMKLHEWIAPSYGEGFSRVAHDKYGRVVGPNTEYHSKPFNDLSAALKTAYEALPGVSDKAFVSLFSHGIDANFLPPDPQAEALEAMGRPRVAPQDGYCSKIVLRLGRPDRLPGLLHHLVLPTNAPVIDQADVENAADSLRLSKAETVELQRQTSRRAR